jgi:transposase-like protein
MDLWERDRNLRRIANEPDREFMTTVIFACPKCGLVHEVTQVHVPTKKSGRFDCVDCGATIHSWYGVFEYSGCKAVRMDRSRGNAALTLRLQILRHLRDRQIQGDVV